MTYDPQAAQRQLNHIAAYSVELQTNSLGLLALIQAIQHHVAGATSPQHVLLIAQTLAQGWQALLADPTTDLGQMLAAGWATPTALPPHPSWQEPCLTADHINQMRHNLTQASRTQVFGLAEALEATFFTYTEQHPGVTNADLMTGLVFFIVWSTWHLEASMEDNIGATRTALLDHLQHYFNQQLPTPQPTV